LSWFNGSALYWAEVPSNVLTCRKPHKYGQVRKHQPIFCEPHFAPGLLVTTIVEAILDGKYPAHLTMKDLMEPFPMDWDRQAEHFLKGMDTI